MVRAIRSILLISLCVMCGMWQPSAWAIEAYLRPKATIDGSIVRLRDVAELSGAGGPADEALVAELAVIPLMPKPAAGTQQFLTVPQLRDLLAACGVAVDVLRFRGSDMVAIGSAPAKAPATATPTTPIRRPERADRDEVARAVGAAIVEYLRQQSGHDLWNVTVSPENKLVDNVSRFGPQIAVSGGNAPWTGRQRFTVGGVGSEQRVLTFAAVDRLEMVIFAQRAIAAGDLVRATDVALRTNSGTTPTQAATSLEAVVGKEATQAIRPGAIVMTSQLRAPFLVRRGERVSVRARAAGVKVSTYATAQQDGSLGDLIAVQPLEGKDRYFARVSGLRELEVFAGGTSAADVAGMTR